MVVVVVGTVRSKSAVGGVGDWILRKSAEVERDGAREQNDASYRLSFLAGGPHVQGTLTGGGRRNLVGWEGGRSSWSAG